MNYDFNDYFFHAFMNIDMLKADISEEKKNSTILDLFIFELCWHSLSMAPVNSILLMICLAH